ncbi:MAG: cysteine desulfurase family protein [Acidobacteria bacterium]|nr:cysteine desulfurase family protein [Acidobacteriota bacterium]
MPDLSPVSVEASALSVAALSQTAASEAGGIAGASSRVPEAAGRPETIYLDHLASTPCDPEAAALMHRVAVELSGNPSSPHASGQLAARYVERAREQVADAVNALPEEVVFTSGATESNNLAILGVAAAARERDERRRRLLTLGIEHPSVLGPFAALGRRGYEVESVPLQRDGRVDLNALEGMLEGALLLSIQAANNETGTIQPLYEASPMAAERGVLVHSDAAQILGKVLFSVEGANLDFVSLSAHKCYGPKGVGALCIRGGVASAPLAPIVFGGGHENGVRPGTLNTPAIAAFGLAAELATERLEADGLRIGALRDDLEARLIEELGDRVRVNGAIESRLPHATSLTFFDDAGCPLDADALVANLPEFDLSTASACHVGTPEPSHVLRAIGVSQAEAYGTLRVGLGRGNVDADTGRLSARLGEVTRTLQRRNRIKAKAP